MSDPVIVACPANEWTKVATNKTSGVVHIKDDTPSAYYQTYRDTTGTAPTDLTEAIPINKSLQISAAAGIDVYVWPVGVAGSVRVDS